MANVSQVANRQKLRLKMRMDSQFQKLVVTLALISFTSFTAGTGVTQEAEWIWYPVPPKNEVPVGATFYRKSFKAEAVEQAEIFIAADDQYDLFLNNKKIGSGSGTEALDRFDVTANIRKGKNVIAVRVENLEGKTGALAARVQVKEKDKGWRSYSTNRTWKTSASPLPIWKFQFFNDSNWRNVQSFGKLGSTPPWDSPAKVVNQGSKNRSDNSAETNSDNSEFFVQEVFGDEEIGSIIAFEFNEFGKIIASPETGGLMILDPDAKSKSSRVRYLTRDINAIQGILPLNGEIYVTGIYQNQSGLYVLRDKDRNDEIDDIEKVISFKGYPGEHGAHGLVLGADGKIYLTLGNHVTIDGQASKKSPYKNFYEGSVVKRYEDPGGHAKGIKAPGGTILRVELDGSNVEVVAGGLRNCYDLAFSKNGDLFTYDSDMETDVGLAWYRPTNLYQVSAGADFGWRSGWAKWPDYYMDSLPAITDTGRGSPTGMVFYNHVMFPVRYQNSLFLADWSGGRIYNVQLSADGASYKTRKEVFVEGSPLNVTDLSVGPDGALYFATGGRMTSGGVFRVKWKGEVPEAYRTLSDNVSKIIRQPQVQSAFARQKLAELQSELGDEWDKTILGVAVSKKNPEAYRLQAIDLMTLFGPTPTQSILMRLSKDSNPRVRAKAVRAMALDVTLDVEERLLAMLEDESRYVQKAVCETLTAYEAEVEFEDLASLLVSPDRYVAHSARKLLEIQDPQAYRNKMLQTDDQAKFTRAALALIQTTRDRQDAYAILARVVEFLDEFISDSSFLEMLRLVQVTIELGDVEAEKIPAFSKKMADEFPSGNALMNLELAKILARLQVDSVLARLEEFLESEDYTFDEKLSVAMHLQLIKKGWTSDQRFALISFLENQVRLDKDGNHGAFIRLAVREFARSLNQDEAITALKKGKQWPNAAMSAFYRIPRNLDDELISEIKRLDRAIQKETGETYGYIKKGIVAVLAQGGGKEGTEYLKEIWRRDSDRRKHVAIAFTLSPNLGNWPYLIASINEVEEEATEIMRSLLRVPQKPEGAKYYRMVIVKAQKLDDSGRIAAANLLEFWTGEPSKNKLDPEMAIDGWKEWFASSYPDEPAAELIRESASQKWTVSLLKEVLTEDNKAEGSKEKGRLVFKKAQCSSCHRFSNYGDSLGPDLTTVARRFTTKEILESIIHPSDVISDQYRSELIATVDGKQISGIVTNGPDQSLIILQSDGTKKQVAEADIEARKKIKTSVMPSNLLENLTKEEIVDLFTFMGLQDENRIAGKQRFITR